MGSPQSQPRVARERRVAGDDVYLAVVEELGFRTFEGLSRGAVVAVGWLLG
jgi:hypothetical protein